MGQTKGGGFEKKWAGERVEKTEITDEAGLDGRFVRQKGGGSESERGTGKKGSVAEAVKEGGMSGRNGSRKGGRVGRQMKKKTVREPQTERKRGIATGSESVTQRRVSGWLLRPAHAKGIVVVGGRRDCRQ